MKHLQKFIVLMSVMALALSLPAPLFGQNLGERLRVTLENSTVIGTVAAKGQSSFELNLSDGRSQRVIHANIQKLERSLGTRNHGKKGFVIGGGTGVIAGYIYGSLIYNTCQTLTFGTADEECDEIGVEAMVLSSVVWGGGLGLGGLLIGTLIRREEWMTISKPSASGRLRVSPMINVVSGQKENPKVVLGARVTF